MYGKIRGGSVAEWLKAHDSKSCGLATVSEVRILSLPPFFLQKWLQRHVPRGERFRHFLFSYLEIKDIRSLFDILGV